MINLSKKITKLVGQVNAKYGLIKQGDKVLVGLSGGKDSLTLVHALKRLQRVTPFDFEFKAVAVSYGMGENLEALKAHCEKYEIDFDVIDTSIFELSKDKIRKNSSFCSFISRLRRGHLYTYALDNGYNKLALGHHLDDAAESFFMNMFYNGSLRSMPPIYKAQNGLEVIRPLIYCRERQLEAFTTTNDISVIGDENCPAMRMDIKIPHAREKTKKFLAKLEEENGDLFTSLKASFNHVHSGTFFDKDKL